MISGGRTRRPPRAATQGRPYRIPSFRVVISTLPDLASSVRWPSSPQPSSPILPPALTGEEGEIRSKMGSGALSLPSGRGGGWGREGWESEGQPRRGGILRPVVTKPPPAAPDYDRAVPKGRRSYPFATALGYISQVNKRKETHRYIAKQGFLITASFRASDATAIPGVSVCAAIPFPARTGCAGLGPPAAARSGVRRRVL